MRCWFFKFPVLLLGKETTKKKSQSLNMTRHWHGICDHFSSRYPSFDLKMSWKSHQMTPFLFKKRYWVKRSMFEWHMAMFSIKWLCFHSKKCLWLESKRMRGEKSHKFRAIENRKGGGIKIDQNLQTGLHKNCPKSRKIAYVIYELPLSIWLWAIMRRCPKFRNQDLAY